MGHRWLWLDVVTLVRSLRPKSHLLRVNYYTAITVESADAQSRQDTYLKALAAQNGPVLRVIRGRYQRRSHLCDACGAKRIVYEEKETDVHIASQLVADAIQHQMDEALVVSGDADYLPAVRMVQAVAPTIRLSAAFPRDACPSAFGACCLLPSSSAKPRSARRNSPTSSSQVSAHSRCQRNGRR
ncbi:MAG: NYN domain-containing protein [Bifidobacteriaceae bacterium]|nr:NYN domain-containing protein [Bifidobacteriaceae bacterium]